MRILVLGGTLFLSRAVAVEAVRRGHEVTCACRATRPVPDGARHLPLDRSADDASVVLADAYDAVVDVARTPSWVRAATAAVPSAHWVFVSSISAYADAAQPGGGPGRTALLDPIDEDLDPRSSPEAYGGMKVACERLVQERTASSLVVRPGLIVGPGDPSGRFTYWVARLADAEGPVLAPGDPQDPVQVVDADDLAAWLVDCAEQRLTGELDAIGPVLGRGEVLSRVAAGVGSEPELTWVDSDTLVAAEVQEWMGPRSLPLWVASPELAGLLTHDPGPAARAGLVSRDVAETARATLAWLRETPDAVITGLTREEERAVLAAVRDLRDL